MLLSKREDGSIALEASLLLPFFLCFILALITLIQIATVEIALQNTVSESTKQLATHMYPLGLLYDRFSETWVGEEFHQRSEEFRAYHVKINTIAEQTHEYSTFFPREVKTVVENLSEVGEGLENGDTGAYNSTLSSTFQAVVDQYADDHLLHLDQLYVIKVSLPNLRDRRKAFWGLEIAYNMPLHLPFIDKTLTFKHQAYERVWAGGTATSGVPRDSIDDPTQLIIDFISSPIQRGHKVYIHAQGPPNRTATIKITYASGRTKEESCHSTANGWFACNYKIGPNSKPGEFQVIITVEKEQATGHL